MFKFNRKALVVPLVLAGLSITGIAVAADASAWTGTASANAACGSNNTVVVSGTYNNQEGLVRRHMNVAMKTAYGTTVTKLVTFGHQGQFVLDTGKATIPSGKVTFELSWTDNRTDTDTAIAAYQAVKNELCARGRQDSGQARLQGRCRGSERQGEMPAFRASRPRS
ncbi:MAG: hypothetical protein WDN27_04175 [Candidatus Saccharibacteria bacterium]